MELINVEFVLTKLLLLRGNSQNKNFIMNVDPTFGGELLYCCEFYISRLKSLSFNKTADL